MIFCRSKFINLDFDIYILLSYQLICMVVQSWIKVSDTPLDYFTYENRVLNLITITISIPLNNVLLFTH